MIKILKILLIKLKNLLNKSNLKTIKKKDNNYLLNINIKQVENNLKCLEYVKSKNVYIVLSYHKRFLNTYYPHLTNNEIKIIFEKKLLLVEQQIIYYNRLILHIEKLEFNLNQKLRKLLNKEDIKDNYELTINLKSDYDLFIAMWKEINYTEIVLDFKHTLKILNVNIDIE